MPAPSKRRSRRPAQDSLRPGWMVNCILFSVLLAAIGACYVWLGVRKKDRADIILSMRREIDELEKQIQEKDFEISRSLAPESLRMRVESARLPLKPIGAGSRGDLIRMPEPLVASGTAAAPEPEPEPIPAYAGATQP